jgi:hypothetical protein
MSQLRQIAEDIKNLEAKTPEEQRAKEAFLNEVERNLDDTKRIQD